jgi:hypothetical protein
VPNSQGDPVFSVEKTAPPPRNHPEHEVSHNPTLVLIAKALAERHGQAYADSWLEKERARQRGQPIAPLNRAKDLLKPTRNPQKQPEPYQAPTPGVEAAKAAQELIGERWRQALGLAYPLVLLAVKGALEAGMNPSGVGQNNYHFITTLPSLAVLCSALMRRDKVMNQRTIERWLSPSAPHARALRCWLGWKVWYTSSYVDYSTGKPMSTKGGTVFRVYLSPLSEASDAQIHPLASAMRQDWRDLEEDRQQGRTLGKRYQNATPDRLEPENVGIYQYSAKELSSKQLVLWEEYGNTPERTRTTFLGEQYYVYPDTKTIQGASVLREDVNTYAAWLGSLVTGKRDLDEVMDRYREAVWVCVKAELYGGTRQGWELLTRLRNLALELRKEKHTLRDPAAYCWSQVEAAGFRELRRDYSFMPGRFYRVIGSRAARELGIMA